MGNILNKLGKIKWKHFVNYIAIAIVTVIFSSMTFAGALPQSTLFLLEKITMNIILAVSLSLVVGFLGELSLGHAGFMCIGAYIGGKVSTLFANGESIIALITSLIVGALVAGIFGFIIGLPALRLRGDYLAIVTLAFGEIVKTVFENTSDKTFGGPIGLRTPRFDKHYLFIIGFVLVLITVFVIQNLLRSKHGRAITAIRDNEIAARATGILSLCGNCGRILQLREFHRQGIYIHLQLFDRDPYYGRYRRYGKHHGLDHLGYRDHLYQHTAADTSYR